MFQRGWNHQPEMIWFTIQHIYYPYMDMYLFIYLTTRG